ncbi:MAG: ATP-binding protein [Pseudomonadota bacterium]
MKSLFLRIYWGILIVLLAVGLMAYTSIQMLNDVRRNAYHEKISDPFTHLIELYLKDLSEPNFYNWMQRINGMHSGMTLKFIPENELTLSPKSIQKLRKTGRLISSFDKGDQPISLLAVSQTPLILIIERSAFEEDHLRAITLVLRDYIHHKSVTVNQTKITTDELQKLLPFPVKIAPFNQIKLEERFHTEFNQTGFIVTSEFINNVAQYHSYVQIDADRVLHLGPMTTLGPVSILPLLGVAILALGLIAVAGYLLVRPIEETLKKMEFAIEKISHGDLDARVFVDRNDALGHLASIINEMVQHLQRLLQSQRDMTNAVSHELRTPVARIRFGLEAIRDSVEDEFVDKQIDHIDQDIEELSQLIDEILTYARLEQGRPALQLEQINIVEIIQRIARESKATGHAIEIELRVGTEDLLAECESRYIHRAVQNLVNNAVRYAKSKVRVSCRSEVSMVRVDVEDDGPGIPQEDWERVFVPFARLDTSRNRKSGGYGLGLSIVQSIAYWHGGVAAVYYSPLGGAKFTILWPRNQSLRLASSMDNDPNLINKNS